ncbi:DUF3224 domain-containing protein [Saccharophagus degradans]|uniref:DUF3224 domain-containing protein n=1 Tax=Saccharophagus degradans TaxID=86304 RepID=UPI002477EDA9|nr:DUF3224 domain-containing protein [Saccharophagus degradans]WGP00117.1 DUF3224 domain-containing protein [Saccharophagus degradans]
MQIKGTFNVSEWQETTHVEAPRKMSSAKVQYQLAGDIEGVTDIVYAMCYLSESQAVFQGVHQVSATINGKKGTFAMLEKGEFIAPATNGTWQIVKGSGTEELTNITGEGTFKAEHGGEMIYELNIRV